MLRVHLLDERDHYGNSHGCGYIRLLLPFSHPELADGFRVSTGEKFPADGVDVVIVERVWRAAATLEGAEALVAAIRRLGAKLIYTLDDNLLDLHRCQPWHEISTDVRRNIVRFFLRQADGVVVSTEPLKERLRKLNSAIQVVPNALDEKLFLPRMPLQQSGADKKLVVGYMGTYSHLHDLMMVLEPLRAVMRERLGAVEFQLVGVSLDERVSRSFEGLPFRALDMGGHYSYPDFVAWARHHLRWNLAIAPLEENEFTHCKSDIKFLDYALLGIPGIYSNVEAYRHTVKHGKTGWLCDNGAQAWHGALTGLLVDPARRSEMAGAAYEYATNNRLLISSANAWKEAVLAFAGNGRVSI